jgi:phosphatidylserine decarboxylase
MFYITVSVLLIILIIYCYWRFFFFYRDPDRNVPSGNNIVSPADGTIVYIKIIDNDVVPISIKKNRSIKLEEIFKCKINSLEKSYLVGIFMHPTNVHVNRAPISGKVEKITYTKSKNLPMTIMWWRVLLGMKPYEQYSNHVLQNERNTIFFQSNIPVFVVQIADIYVNKIECWVSEQQEIQKGQRIGMIKMGSQVDMLFPSKNVSEIVVKVGQKVKAGETIIACII